MARRKPQQTGDQKRVRALGWVNSLALLAGLGLSMHLWIGDTSYPATPVLPFLPELPAAFGLIGLVALAAFAIAAAFTKRPRRYYIGLVVTGAILVLLDQNRLQPWFYYYLFIGIVLAWAAGQPKRHYGIALDGIRIMAIGIYVWAGIQKLNYSFVGEVFPWVIEPMLEWTGLEPGTSAFATFAIVSALCETAIGVGLLIPRTRKIAVLTAIGMHGFLLLMLGPLGHNWNSVVWPWNVAMPALLFTLFWGVDEPMFKRLARPKVAVQWAAAALFIAAPALSFVGAWDSYLSAKLYSGNTETAYLLVSPQAMNDLPTEMREAQESGMISVAMWSIQALNVPAYPERRIWKSALIQAHRLGLDDTTRLIVRERPHWRTGEADWTVYTLGADDDLVVDERATRLLAAR